jgi:predicted Zn-dependent protease
MTAISASSKKSKSRQRGRNTRAGPSLHGIPPSSFEPLMRPAAVVTAAVLIGSAFRLDAQCSAAVRKLQVDKKFDEAKSEVRALLKSNDKDDAAMHCLGVLAMDQNDAKESVEWFERAVRQNDKSSAHHLWLGNALGEQASHTAKIKLPFLARRIKSEFDRAAQLDPTSIDARHGLIEFYSMAPSVMGGSMDKAKEQAREIAKLSAWRGHFEMGRVLERDKDLDGTEKEFMAAVAAAPDSNLAYNALASFYRRQKRWDAAVGTYESLLKRRPEAIIARLNIAGILVQAGINTDRAEREARAWLAAPPADAPKVNFANAHYLLGQIGEKQQKKDAARAEYQQALSFDPAHQQARKALEALK